VPLTAVFEAAVFPLAFGCMSSHQFLNGWMVQARDCTISKSSSFSLLSLVLPLLLFLSPSGYLPPLFLCMLSALSPPLLLFYSIPLFA